MLQHDDGANSLLSTTKVLEHLEFIANMLEKYDDLDGGIRDNLRKRLDNIRLRSADHHLYLAVVGEMSTGKTTLINAFLRDDLLDAQVTTMTTASATVIRSGSERSAILQFLDQNPNSENTMSNEANQRIDGLEALHGIIGTQQEEVNTAIQSLKVSEKDAPITLAEIANVKNLGFRDFLRQVTTDDDLAQRLSNVILTHPAEFLDQGIVIIDTPGIDATVVGHDDVTRRAVAAADSALVIIPADKPVSESLSQFIRDGLADYLHRCLFLVTRMDMIRAKDRELLIETIKMRLQDNLDLDEPRIWVSAAQAIMDDIVPEDERGVRREKDREAFKAAFLDFETDLLFTLRRQRQIIIAENLLRLIDTLLNELQAPLDRLWENYNAQAAAIDANKIQNVQVFAREQHQELDAEMNNIITLVTGELERIIGLHRDRALGLLNNHLQVVSTREALQSFLANEAPYILNQDKRDVDKNLHILAEMVAQQSEILAQRFDKSFEVAYEQLSALKRGSAGKNAAQFVNLNLESNQTLGTARGVDALNRVRVVFRTGGGTLAGAALGSTILPGIGTLIGGVVGGLAGRLVSPTIETRRDAAWKRIQSEVTHAYNQVYATAERDFHRLGQEYAEIIHTHIEAHVNTYQGLIKDIQAEQDEIQVELQLKQRRLAHDTRTINERRETIQADQASLKEL